MIIFAQAIKGKTMPRYTIELIMELQCDTIVDPMILKGIVEEHFTLNNEIDDPTGLLPRDYLEINRTEVGNITISS